MSDLIVRGGAVLTADSEEQLDLRICDGTVVEMGHDIQGHSEVLDATGLVVGPGLVDLHVHFREPGQEWKEDIASGSSAAAAGGYTAVVAMPNTDPPTDSGHQASYIESRGRQVGLVDVHPAGCITAAMGGESLAHLDELFAAGVRVFTDDGVTVADAGLLRQAMEYLSDRDVVMAQHAEDPGLARGGHMHEGVVSSMLGMAGLPELAESSIVARDLSLVALTGVDYHVQHVSCAATVELIRRAKNEGLPVTAEVAPHHVMLTENAVESMNPVFKMYPPLRTASDVSVLAEALADGTIDAVATDHAPHASHEKDVPFSEAPRGVIGLETAFGVIRSSTSLDRRRLFDAMSVRPARIARLATQGRWIDVGTPANLTVVDWDHRWTPGRFESKSNNSPFAGHTLTGAVRATIFGGTITFRHNDERTVVG